MDTGENERFVRIFNEQIPEIEDGIVEIKAIARMPGIRSKVAILSRDPNVDAMWVCVGPGGSRLHRIIDELHGERIELVHWYDSPQDFIVNALQPAEIEKVLLDLGRHQATVVVRQDQLSFLTGSRGSQNRELASQLCGWQIEVEQKEKEKKKGTGKKEGTA